jgi:hypothetical protein
MIMTYPMRVYYIAYQYQCELEMIAGPFGTSSEAHQERDRLIGERDSDDRLHVVCDWREVTIS